MGKFFVNLCSFRLLRRPIFPPSISWTQKQGAFSWRKRTTWATFSEAYRVPPWENFLSICVHFDSSAGRFFPRAYHGRKNKGPFHGGKGPPGRLFRKPIGSPLGKIFCQFVFISTPPPADFYPERIVDAKKKGHFHRGKGLGAYGAPLGIFFWHFGSLHFSRIGIRDDFPPHVCQVAPARRPNTHQQNRWTLGGGAV